MLTIVEAARALDLTVASVCQAIDRGALAATTTTVAGEHGGRRGRPTWRLGRGTKCNHRTIAGLSWAELLRCAWLNPAKVS